MFIRHSAFYVGFYTVVFFSLLLSMFFFVDFLLNFGLARLNGDLFYLFWESVLWLLLGFFGAYFFLEFYNSYDEIESLFLAFYSILLLWEAFYLFFLNESTLGSYNPLFFSLLRFFYFRDMMGFLLLFLLSLFCYDRRLPYFGELTFLFLFFIIFFRDSFPVLYMEDFSFREFSFRHMPPFFYRIFIGLGLLSVLNFMVHFFRVFLRNYLWKALSLILIIAGRFITFFREDILFILIGMLCIALGLFLYYVALSSSMARHFSLFSSTKERSLRRKPKEELENYPKGVE